MQNIPLALIWEKLIYLILPGMLVSFLTSAVLFRWRLAGLAVLLGFIAANVHDQAIEWFDWDLELGRLMPAMACSLLLMPWTHKTWGQWSSVALVGLLCLVLFWHEDVPWLHRLAAVLVSVLVCISIHGGQKKLPGWNLHCLLAVSGLVTAIVMIHAHTARLSDIGLMWMGACAGCLLCGLIFKGQAHGLAELASVLFPLLLYYGVQTTDSRVPVWSFVLIPAAFCSCFLLLRQTNPKWHWIVTTVWVILSAIAAILAMCYETVAAV